MSALVILVLFALQQIPSSANIHEKPLTVVVAGCQFENLIQGGSYVPGNSKLTWRRHERANAQSVWQDSTNTYSTRYSIIDVGARLGGDELFVAGVLSTGESVLERWRFPARDGGWSHAPTGTAPPIGQSAGAYAGTTAINGNGYRNLPATWLAPSISVVFESNSLGEIRSVEVDPEGRFVLFTTMAGASLYQLDLQQSGATPVLLFDSSTKPELADANWLAIGDHKDFGRTVVCLPPNIPAAARLPTPPSVVLLKDADNDGVFEGSGSMSISDYLNSTVITPVSTPPVTPPTWTAPWAWFS